MRRLALGLIVVKFAFLSGINDLYAQSRRPVTIVFRQSSTIKTQYSPDAVSADASSQSGSPTTGSQPSSFNASPSAMPMGQTMASFQSNGPSVGVNANDAIPMANRPTLQQMQNPSGMFLMTHANELHNQYYTTNTYMGNQFNTWNNVRMQPTQLDQFESFNRTQPPTTTQGYVSPNTYMGTNFNTWTNLSSGNITPNYLGSYTYQQGNVP